MLEVIIKVVIGFVIAGFMWSVLNSLEQIAKDLRIIAKQYDSKFPLEGPGDQADV